MYGQLVPGGGGTAKTFVHPPSSHEYEGPLCYFYSMSFLSLSFIKKQKQDNHHTNTSLICVVIFLTGHATYMMDKVSAVTLLK